MIGKRIRLVLVPLLLGVLFYYAYKVHPHYSIQDWLIWRYLIYWICTGVWLAACLTAGHATTRRIVGHGLPFFEQATLSLAVGILEFGLVMFVAGLFGLYGTPLFFVLPCAMLAIGGPSSWRYLRKCRRHFRISWSSSKKLSPGYLLAILFGIAGLAAVYFLLLSPENIQFDARWKHLALAENFVIHGGIHRFPEGWAFHARPHFSSFLYTWAFLLPGGRLFDWIELSFHIEFAVFVWTTFFGITAVVRAIVPDADPRVVWVARFLFPGVLLYDGCLGGGADHIGALYGPALFLLTLRAYRQLTPSYCFLAALMMSTALMIKYTVAVMFVPCAVFIISLRALLMIVDRLRGRRERWRPRGLYISMPLMVVTCVATTTPHWLKNSIWYGNPVYPLMAEHFDSRPWHRDASYMYEHGYARYQFWRPTRDLDGVWETAKALVKFSFEPNNYDKRHKELPIFGALFTLLLVCLPFLRRTRRLWGLVAWTHLGLFAWYWIHHQDRYLQALAPWMAACVAVVIVKVWRVRSWPITIPVAALISFQVIAGSDVFFIRTGERAISRPARVVQLLGRGLLPDYGNRLRTQYSFTRIAKALPPDAVVLRHENHAHLGIGRPTVTDWATYQFGINYRRLRTPRRVYDSLHELGVTHIMWEKRRSMAWDSVAADIVFFNFVYRHAVNHKRHGRHIVAEMPPERPAKGFSGTVALWGCNRRSAYRNGRYYVRDLRVPVFGPRNSKFPRPRSRARNEEGMDRILAQADFAVIDPRCQTLKGRRRREFELVAKRERVWKLRNRRYEIWIRKRAETKAPGSTPPAEAPPPQPPTSDAGPDASGDAG